MQHQFITTSHDLSGLFNGVNLFSTLVRRIEEQSTIGSIRYDPDKYKGDAFEFFVELFLTINATDNRVFVYNYKPIPSDEIDIGADGMGTNILGEDCVVQIKYRRNSEHLLTGNDDHLTNLINAGAHMGIAYDRKNKKNFRHFVFTTAKELHFRTNEQTFKGKVKCFGYEEFRKMVDNNIPFWNKCREMVRELDPRLQLIEV
jgi:hypothetical protein